MTYAQTRLAEVATEIHNFPDSSDSDLLRRIELKEQEVADKLSNYIVNENGCWVYQGYTTPTHYGQFHIYCKWLKVKKRKFAAHRVAYAFHNGVDPADKCVCHQCDNPSCINPDHLWLGTLSDNSRDMVRKGRQAQQDGELNAGSKLNEAKVLEIVARVRQGEQNKQIAADMGVNHGTVSLVRLGKTWKVLLDQIGYEPLPCFARKTVKPETAAA